MKRVSPLVGLGVFVLVRWLVFFALVVFSAAFRVAPEGWGFELVGLLLGLLGLVAGCAAAGRLARSTWAPLVVIGVVTASALLAFALGGGWASVVLALLGPPLGFAAGRVAASR